MGKLNKLSDVVDWRLCVGCGACSYICPDNRVQLIDYITEGIRPVVSSGDCKDCTLCLDVCPGVEVDFALQPAENKIDSADSLLSSPSFRENWGQVLEVWEGHAADPEIRLQGSSGGVLSALAAYCVEQAGMTGVLHTGQDPDAPLLNRTRLSGTRSEILAASGSRYSPASVCNGLDLVENAATPCAIIGQPSEIAAVSKARRLRPALDRKIGLTMSFFCAGSPPTTATTALLEQHKIPSAAVADLRYRGQGWPGHFAPVLSGQSEPAIKLTYKESWTFLQRFRPWSVQLWPDGSGELADISCGDPWYNQPDGVNPGSSLVLVRTGRGREILRGAIAAGYVQLAPAEAWKVERSQSGLWKKKGEIWGRQLALSLLRLPHTCFYNANLFACWRRLRAGVKIASILGTLRRIIQRKFYRSAMLPSANMAPVKPATTARTLVPSLK